jgi:hypothetical protein
VGKLWMMVDSGQWRSPGPGNEEAVFKHLSFHGFLHLGNPQKEDIPTASHSPKGEWRHMTFTIDTVSQDREGSTHLL